MALAALGTAAFLLFASTSCERGVYPEFTVSKDTLNFAYTADTADIDITSNVEWWIYTRPSFLMMSPLDSNASCTAKVYVTANTSSNSRDTLMRITTETIRREIVIHQAPNPSGSDN